MQVARWCGWNQDVRIDNTWSWKLTQYWERRYPGLHMPSGGTLTEHVLRLWYGGLHPEHPYSLGVEYTLRTEENAQLLRPLRRFPADELS